jgi:hypothetical protein
MVNEQLQNCEFSIGFYSVCNRVSKILSQYIYTEEVKKPEPKIIPAKRIDELTDEERKILIENERAGIKNPYYNVKLFKNGNVRICKAKKPTLSQQIISNNGERVFSNTTAKGKARDEVHDGKVYMTDNQLMW